VKKSIGLERGMVKLEDYSPVWADSYHREESLIQNLFGDSITALAHVGSTSIPGIRSKPIIDIILVLESNFDLGMAVELLASIGFMKGDFVRDEGVFLLKGIDDFHTHYLHLVSAHHSWPKYIFFRDYMLQHPEDAKEYERLKLGLEDLYSKDRPLYTAAKKDFIHNIMAKMPEGYLQTNPQH
jgi:GrpB-like predicted nucleotidyltransferase (UPF0157 family)